MTSDGMMIEHLCLKTVRLTERLANQYRRLSVNATIEIWHESSSVFPPLTTVDNV